MSWDWTAETRERLQDFLRARALMDGEPKITPIGDGHSNLTYLLRRDDKAMVLRRPPPPPLAPGSNDVLREARLLRALEPSGAPVPRVLASGETGELFDVPFYIMAHVPGIVVTNDMPDALSDADTVREMGFAMVDALADLHQVDWRAAGLSDFGKPEGFNQRHLRRMAGLVSGRDGIMPPEFAETHAWLETHVPAEAGATIIHNDFRIGNLMWAASPPARLLAILDWELATLGDPLFDLAYLVASIPQPGIARTPTQDMARATLHPDFPTVEKLADRYATRTGRDLAYLRWYLVMVNWKLAILYNYSRQRGMDPYYAAPGLVESFLTEARRHVAADMHRAEG